MADRTRVTSDERRRLSRELHDQVGEQLTSLILGLRALWDGGQLTASGQELLELLQGTAEEVAPRLPHRVALVTDEQAGDPGAGVADEEALHLRPEGYGVTRPEDWVKPVASGISQSLLARTIALPDGGAGLFLVVTVSIITAVALHPATASISSPVNTRSTLFKMLTYQPGLTAHRFSPRQTCGREPTVANTGA